MRPTVDRDICTGCGVCEEVSPEVFRIDDEGLAYVVTPEPGHETWDDVRAALESCPVAAISIES